MSYYQYSVTLRYMCRTFPQKCSSYYPESTNPALVCNIDMILDYMNSGIFAIIPKSCYPALGLTAGPGDVCMMDSTKDHTDEAMRECGEAMFRILTDKFAGIFLKNTKFLLSDTPTIADFRFAPMLIYIKIATKLPSRLEEYFNDDMGNLPLFLDTIKKVIDFAQPKWKI